MPLRSESDELKIERARRARMSDKPTTQPKFKVGDRVRWSDGTHRFTVDEVTTYDGEWAYRSCCLQVKESELTLDESEAFECIVQ